MLSLGNLLKKLDRYVLSEFWLPLLSGAGVITGVWLGIDQFKDIFKLLARSGASLSTGFVILGLEIPQILAITIPISILLATFLAFQKLSGQSEVLAMRAAGVSFSRLMKPVLILGLAGTVTSFLLSECVVPITTSIAKKIYSIALYQSPIPKKSKESFSYFEKDSNGTIKRIFYVKAFKDDTLRNIVILDFSQAQVSQIYTAKRGQWSPEKGGWTLMDGSSHYIKNGDAKELEQGQEGYKSSLDLVSSFDTTFIPSSFNPKAIQERISSINDMNFIELNEFIKLHQRDILYTDKLHSAQTKFHNRFAYPFSCVLFAIIGACLGITGRRKVINWGYIALGLVVFVFYMSQSIFDSFGDSGRVAPMLAVWMSNFVLTAIAAAAFWYRAER